MKKYTFEFDNFKEFAEAAKRVQEIEGRIQVELKRLAEEKGLQVLFNKDGGYDFSAYSPYVELPDKVSEFKKQALFDSVVIMNGMKSVQDYEYEKLGIKKNAQ